MALVTAYLGTLPTEPYVLTGDHVITSGPRRPSQAAADVTRARSMAASDGVRYACTGANGHKSRTASECGDGLDWACSAGTCPV